MVLFLNSCSRQAVDSNETIPSQVSNIEFWNGGTCIRKYSNVSIRVIHLSQILRTDIDYILYEIQTERGLEKIVDSESLTIVFSE